MRRPVLLVPGWSDRAAQLDWQRRAFIDAGWPESFVTALEFENRFGSNIAHAAEIAVAVERLCHQNNAAQIDVVAHSMGGLALRYYLHFEDGARRVRRVVFTGTPHRGTWVAYLGLGDGAREMRPGHALLHRLNEMPAVPPGVAALGIHTPTETRVFPRSSALLPEGANVRVWCRSHAALLRSKKAFAAIRAFLEE